MIVSFGSIKFIFSTTILLLALTAISTNCSPVYGHDCCKESFEKFCGWAHHYADRLHGRKTASGEVHDCEKFTAAHKTLPFGTKLKVTNKKNGKACVVVVNDRGPHGPSPNLVIDLSKAAAKELGFGNGGKVHVDCQIVSKQPHGTIM